MKNIRYLLRIIRKASKGYVTISVLKQTIEDVFYVFFEIYLIQYIFDSVEKGISYRKVIFTLTGMAVGQMFIHFFSAGYDYYMLRTNPLIFKYIYAKVINKAKSLPLYCFEDSQYYDRYVRALEETQQRAEQLVKNLSKVISQSMKFLVTVGIMVKWSPVILLFPVISFVNSITVNQIRSKMEFARNNELTKDKRKADYAMRIFSEKKYANEIRLFPILNKYIEKHKRSYEYMSAIYSKYFNKLVWLDIWEKLVCKMLVFVGSSIYVTYEIMLHHRFTIGVYMSIMVAINSISWTVEGVFTNYSELKKHNKLIKNLRDFLESEHVKETRNDIQKMERIPNLKSIEFRNVSFAYAGTDKNILENINVIIHKNEKIALVGKNGVGKTTFIKLLMKLYTALEGSVRYNGQDINEIQDEAYYNKIALIMQDYQIYAVSIADNVLMRQTKTKEDEELVVECLKRVQMYDTIAQLPNGIHTNLTKEFDSNGVLFSGGQLQRIALARVFAKKEAEILILDEPSSALDPISEYNLLNEMIKAGKDKTMICISHRLSMARLADRVFYMEDGKISEIGTHDELMEKNRGYAKLFLVQAKNYLNY